MSHIDTLNESRLSISRDILITIKFKRIVVFPPLEPFSSPKVTWAVSFLSVGDEVFGQMPPPALSLSFFTFLIYRTYTLHCF